jgi:hypothetical protein
MSTTSSQPNPTVHGRHEESRNPTPTTSEPYPNVIPLTDLRSVSQESVHSSAPTAQATPSAPNPPAQPTQGNVQAAPVQTWYQRIWAYVWKTLTSWCTACGPPQLLLGLVGLGLSIVVLKLAIYSYQLSRWTAWKDFRQDCRSLNVSGPNKTRPLFLLRFAGISTTAVGRVPRCAFTTTYSATTYFFDYIHRAEFGARELSAGISHLVNTTCTRSCVVCFYNSRFASGRGFALGD